MMYSTVFHVMHMILDKFHVQVLIVGGFALNAYHVTRQTNDIDFVMTDKDYEQIQNILGECGYQEYYAHQNFVRFADNNKKLMDMDVIFVDESTFQKMYDSGIEMNFEGFPFRVLSLKHLIAMKLHSIKNNPIGRELKDLPDIVSLLRVDDTISKNVFRELCDEFGTPDICKKVLSYLERDRNG